MSKKRFLYTLVDRDKVLDRDKVPVYQCFNYKEAKAFKILYEIEYETKLKVHRIEY